MDRAVLDGVALRPATEADRELLLRVYGTARAEELAQVEWPEGQLEAFVRMQFDAQDAEYRRVNPEASFDVVEVDGEPAGRLYVDRRPTEVRVVDISLLPEFRGRGIGGRLLADVMAEAAASGRPVTIHVELHNRAGRLCERLGFRPVHQQGIYLLLRWEAP